MTRIRESRIAAQSTVLGVLYADHVTFDLRHPYLHRASTDALIIIITSGKIISLK